jgi:hypothetical protein
MITVPGRKRIVPAQARRSAAPVRPGIRMSAVPGESSPLSPSPRPWPPRTLTASSPGVRVDERGLVIGPWSDGYQRVMAARRRQLGL